MHRKLAAIAGVTSLLFALTSTPGAFAQSQTYDSDLKLCNRTSGPLSASYILPDTEQAKPAQIFLASGACQTVSLSGYTGKVGISGQSLGQPAVSFGTANTTAAGGGLILAVFSSSCSATNTQKSLCLQPQR